MLIKTHKEEFLSYLEDTSNLKSNADKLFIPENKDELLEIIRDCSRKKYPLTCIGARTGTTGGSVPMEGGILSLEKLNKINDIDVKNKSVKVSSGGTFRDLEEKVNKLMLTFSSKPTETLATIGGGVSTSASGLRGFGYGSIRNYIQGMEIILSDGTKLKIRRGDIFANGRKLSFCQDKKVFDLYLPTYKMPAVKSQAGYFVKDNMDLIDLFIGSEGTLCVIVDIEISLQDLPKRFFDAVVFFRKEEEGFNFVDKVKEIKRKKELLPVSLEFFDANSLAFLKVDYPNIPSAECAVYFEQEGETLDNNVIDKWVKLLEVCGAKAEDIWLADTEKERIRIEQVRYRLPERINDFLRTHKQTKIATDIAVPKEYFKEMYEFYKTRGKESRIHFVNFGHIGEEHLHFNFLPKTDEEYIIAKQIVKEFVRKAVSFGGTVSAEHGIGKLKKEYLEIMYGKKHIEEMVSLKRQLDENFILGRGNIFDPPMSY